jgi:hypothetical protein
VRSTRRSAKNDDGTFGIKRRPFTLWLGSWWVDMPVGGLGMPTHFVNGEPSGFLIPCVNVEPVPLQRAPQQRGSVDKHSSMPRVGLPDDSVRQKMLCDGFSGGEID